jgi:hypothetical protein
MVETQWRVSIKRRKTYKTNRPNDSFAAYFSATGKRLPVIFQIPTNKMMMLALVSGRNSGSLKYRDSAKRRYSFSRLVKRWRNFCLLWLQRGKPSVFGTSYLNGSQPEQLREWKRCDFQAFDFRKR